MDLTSKADRGDQHMTASTDGRAVELYGSIRRILLSTIEGRGQDTDQGGSLAAEDHMAG